MNQRVEAILLEGIVDRMTYLFQTQPPCSVFRLFNQPKEIVSSIFPLIRIGDRIRAVCLAKPNKNGQFETVDVINNDNRVPITREQRGEQARRVGLRPIYEAPAELTLQPIIGKITEIGLELISHLKRHPELMQEMHSEAFEKLIAELMASGGFDVEWTGRNAETAGDVIAFKMDSGSGLINNYIVECKRYAPSRSVGIEIARAIYGAKVDEGYSNALLVTTSHFQDGVEQFALRHWDFQIKDFKRLVEWLNRYRPKEDGRLHMEDRRLVIDEYTPAKPGRRRKT